MGQGEVLKAVEDLGFTSLEELQRELNATVSSITHSLTRLIKWQEVTAIQLGRRMVYFSEEFLEEFIENEQ